MIDILLVDKLHESIPGEIGYEYSSSDVSVNGKRLNVGEDSVQINDDGSMDSCANEALAYNQLGAILRSNYNNTGFVHISLLSRIHAFDCLLMSIVMCL